MLKLFTKSFSSNWGLLRIFHKVNISVMWKQGVRAVGPCSVRCIQLILRRDEETANTKSRRSIINLVWRHQVTCSQLFPWYTPLIINVIEFIFGKSYILGPYSLHLILVFFKELVTGPAWLNVAIYKAIDTATVMDI